MNVIEIENLWKEYRLGVIGHGTITRDLQSWWARIRGKDDPNAQVDLFSKGLENQIEGDQFWALRDINIQVKQGEILGVIGRNGAGKSTLLKILSRVTAPSKGEVKIKGRIASLLEVGTGFHQELTGKENIYMNGSILGMSKSEINNKIDEIIDFSGVEDFIDTPVKRYSSGMRVRLAFAVAAHLEPEIMVIDEVLAVGDAEFQRKCLGKMEEVSREGRTIIFVSHQMAAVENLCTHCHVLSSGKTTFNGDVKSAIEYYLDSYPKRQGDRSLPESVKRSGTGEIIVVGCAIEDKNGHQVSAVGSGQDVYIAIDYKVNSLKPVKNFSIGFSILGNLGNTLTVLYSDYSGVTFSKVPNKGTVRCRISNLPLSIGRYHIGARLLVNRTEVDWPKGHLASFEVQAGDFYKTGCTPHSGVGPILLNGDWSIVGID